MKKLNRVPIASLPVPTERVRLRMAFGVSQAELASALQVTRKTVYSWEHGQGEPTGDNRKRYGQVLADWAASEQLVTDADDAMKSGDVIRIGTQ